MGKAAGQRRSLEIFTYTKPKGQLQKNHNKEAFAIMEHKHSQIILDRQSIFIMFGKGIRESFVRLIRSFFASKVSAHYLFICSLYLFHCLLLSLFYLWDFSLLVGYGEENFDGILR